jgi:hypothetical protein
MLELRLVNYQIYWAGQMLSSDLPLWDRVNPETMIMKLETKVEYKS